MYERRDRFDEEERCHIGREKRALRFIRGSRSSTVVEDTREKKEAECVVANAYIARPEVVKIYTGCIHLLTVAPRRYVVGGRTC